MSETGLLWSLLCAGQCELHEGSITHMALIESGSMLVTISSDGIMMLSSVDLLVKGLPIGHAPILDLPPVHLMRQSDLVAMDDRITDLKNQVSYDIRSPPPPSPPHLSVFLTFGHLLHLEIRHAIMFAGQS